MAKSTYSGSDGSSNETNRFKLFKVTQHSIDKYYYGSQEAMQKRLAQLESKSFKKIRDEKLKDDLERLETTYNEDLKLAGNDAKKRVQLERDYNQQRKTLQREYNQYCKDHEDEFHQERFKHEQEAIIYAEKLNNQLYKGKTLSQRSIYDREKILEIQKAKNAEEHNLEELQARLDIADTYEDQLELQDQINKSQQTLLSLEYEEETIKSRSKQYQETLLKAQFSYLDAKQRQALIDEKITEENAEQAKLRQELVDLATDPAEYLRRQGIELNAQTAADQIRDAEAEIAKKMQESVERTATMIAAAGEDVRAAAEAKVNDEFLENLKKTVDLKTDNAAKKEMLSKDSKSSERKAAKEVRALERESQKLDEQEKAKQANEDFGPLLKENLKSQVSLAAGMTAGFKALEDLSKSIDQNIESFYEYQGTINARLQGTDETFKDISKNIKKNVGFSGIVSQKEIVNNIKQLTDSGVAYNLEVRAFLASVSENIANTFSAFDSNLLRIIRIQQADTTAARLGMEASLTKLFNQYFSDSSYLTDAFDSVTESILDASAQMTRDQSMEFEYIVQKWLGALYSLGLSQDAVSTIAQGINYLGTGNVDALNNNDALRTLMAMSASNAGMDFGQILVDGLDPDGTNLLMKSMIQYLADIASNTSTNQVTKAVYAELFGVSTPDLNVFTNLSSSVDSLFASTQTYNQSMNEVSNQLSQVASRLHLSQIIDTAFENVQLETATNIGGNAATYGLWKTLNVIEGLTGGIQIPAFSVFGNMVDLDTTVTALAKTGIAGLSMMSSLLGGLFSGNLFGSLDLKSWGFDEYTSRGAAPTQIRSGMASGTSESSQMNMVGSSSSDDIKSTSMTDATDQANEDKEITNKDVKQNVDIYEQIRDALWESESVTALSELKQIRQRMDKPFKAEMDAIHSLYRKVWWVQARILGQDQSFYTEQGPQGSEGDSTSSSGGEETVTVVNLTQDYVDKLQETLLGATYKVEVTNIDALASGGGSSGGNGELSTKVEETTNQLTEAIDKQISETEDVLTTLVTDQNKKDQAGEEVSVTEGDNSTTSNYNKTEDTTLIDGTDALSSLLSLLSLDRVFKVEFDSLDGSTTSNILSQLVQSGDSSSSSITSIVDEIQNNSIMDSISQLHADVTTVKSTLGITDGNTEGGKVVVTGMSDEMKSYINNAIKSMIAQALSDQATQEANKEGENDLATTLQKALSLMNVNVNVTNDFFNEFLQKNAFIN